MTFHFSQLGRFGTLGARLVAVNDPDHRSAHLYAVDGQLVSSRPSLAEVLGHKGFLPSVDCRWDNWQQRFATLLSNYRAAGGRLLEATCPNAWAGFRSGSCGHELIPPLSYWNLRGFSEQLLHLTDNLVLRPNGTPSVDPKTNPNWLFVITSAGEILVGSEDFKLIKHTCLAGGLKVWSAGQVGIKENQIRLVDLNSGHYVIPNVPRSGYSRPRIVDFTKTVFTEYCMQLDVVGLHARFDCVWE